MSKRLELNECHDLFKVLGPRETIPSTRYTTLMNCKVEVSPPKRIVPPPIRTSKTTEKKLKIAKGSPRQTSVNMQVISVHSLPLEQ